MKEVFVFAVLFFLFQLLGQQDAFSQTVPSQKQLKSFTFPTLPKYSKTLDNFVLKGWEIIDSVAGDLNRDNIEDAAVILEFQDSVVESNRAIWRDSKQKTKPRILLLLLSVGNHYELKVQQNELMLRKNETDDTYPEDPYSGMEITKGVLHLNFKWNVRGGGQEEHYIIRYQSNDFYLIGYTFESGYHSDVATSDFNFSTKKYKACY
jgi:hypothetical protein